MRILWFYNDVLVFYTYYLGANLLYTTKSKIRILTATSKKHVMKIKNILVISDIGGQTVGVSDQNCFSYTIRYH